MNKGGKVMTDGKRSEAGSGQGGEVVLITGASGFIAAALIAQLGERYTVVGLDRAGPPDPPPPAAATAIHLGSDDAVRAIGRAPCRARVCTYELLSAGPGSLKTLTKQPL